MTSKEYTKKKTSEKKSLDAIDPKRKGKNKDENLQQALARIQRELKAPKNLYNDFSNFDYRSCEGILEAVKPLLEGCHLLIKDEVVLVGDRYYIKATVMLSDDKESVQTSAFAREALEKKGMDKAQITGSASSYARKYALNGLFAIDDAQDPDTKNNESKKTKTKGKAKKMTATTVGSFIEEMKKELTKDNIEIWERKIKEKNCSDQQRAVCRMKLKVLVKDLK